MPAPASRPAKLRGALPSAEPSARVAAIVADGTATSPPKLPAALASSTVRSGGIAAKGSSADAALDLSVYMAPGGRLRIGADGVPLKFALAAAKGGAAAATARAIALASAETLGATAVVAAAAQRVGAGRSSAGATGVGAGAVDAVLAHQLSLLVALVGRDSAAALDLAGLMARRAQPTLVAESAKTLLNPAEDIETRHGLSFLQL